MPMASWPSRSKAEVRWECSERRPRLVVVRTVFRREILFLTRRDDIGEDFEGEDEEDEGEEFIDSGGSGGGTNVELDDAGENILKKFRRSRAN